VLNHLAGRAPHYFESGLGFTYATFTGEDEDFFGGGGNLLIPSIGYRYQAIGKGFIGRVVLSPVVNLGEGGGWFLFGGVSAGLNFRFTKKKNPAGISHRIYQLFQNTMLPVIIFIAVVERR
jgi:hypothetical protein